MKHMGVRGAAALLLLTLSTLALAGSADKTFTGVVSDDMCGRRHTMMPGKPDADCVRACVKAGSKYALVTPDKVYKLDGPSAQIDKLAGANATVTGTLTGDTIKVSAIAPAKKT